MTDVPTPNQANRPQRRFTPLFKQAVGEGLPKPLLCVLHEQGSVDFLSDVTAAEEVRSNSKRVSLPTGENVMNQEGACEGRSCGSALAPFAEK